MKLFDEEIAKFFRHLLFSAIDYREKNHIEIHDMIHLLIQIRKEGRIRDGSKDKDAGFAIPENSREQQKSANEKTS